nr:hypothetical protein [Bernardetiaceae bacterium]
MFNPAVASNFQLDIDDISIFPLGTMPTQANYTVGTAASVAAATATFTSLTRNGGGFFEVLNFVNNVSGANTFNINSSIPTENGTNPLLQLTGMSAANVITVRPSVANVLLTGGSNPLINFNGADWVTIDGSNGGALTGAARLTFRQTGNNVTIQFSNDATNNQLQQCVFTNNSNTTNGTVFVTPGTGTTGNDNLTINGCSFGQFGTPTAPINGSSTPTRALVINGGVAATTNNNVIVTNNLFFNFFRASSGNGVVSSDGFNTNLRFENNSIYQTVNFNTTNNNEVYYDAVSLNSNGKIVVRNNYFGGQAPQAAGNRFVLNQGTGKASRIQAFIVGTSGNDSIKVEGNVVGNITHTVVPTSLSVGTGGVNFTGISINAGANGIASVRDNVVGSQAYPITINLDDTGDATSGGGAGTNYPFIGINFSGNGARGFVQNNAVGQTVLQYPNGANRRTFTYQGMVLNPSGSGLRVEQNTVSFGLMSANTPKDVFMTGIAYTGAGNSTLANNTVSNLTNNSVNANSFLYGYNHTGTGRVTFDQNNLHTLTGAAAQSFGTAIASVVGARFTSAASHIFSQNAIYNLTANVPSGTSAIGLMLTGGVEGQFRNNRIYDIRCATGGSNSVAAGINVRGVGAACYIFNNMITLGVGSTDNTHYLGVWNNLTTPDPVKFWYNTVYVGGDGTGTTLPSFGYLRGDFDAATDFAALPQLIN